MAVRNLREGTVLKSKYRIGQVLGFGGFGITYLARNLELSQTVVIKEYFPMDLAYRDAEKGEVSLTLPREKNDRKVYQKGKKDFLSEARRMSALSEVPSVVKVLDWFEENETAYLVMEHVRGMGLDRYLERLDEPLSFQEAWKLMLPVLDGLEKVHEKGIIHRDFNPSNLMMQENGTLKMIDFGAARGYLDTEKTMTVLVKRGYAPPEQYLRHGPQGPWTDLYAVCATLYEMVTGVRPQPSIERMQKDQLYLPSAYGAEITPEEEKVLCRGLELTPIHRFRSVKELKEAFLEEEPKGEKKEKKKMMIIIAAAVIVCIAAAGGIWQYRIAKEEAVLKSYAGNYGKETEKYQEFLTFVKDNAVAEEETEPNEFFPEQGTSMVYTLPTEAVEEWGEPCNQFRLHETRDGLLEWLAPLYAMYAGMGAVFGHNYPFYMKFKGGKGIATTAGLLASTLPLPMVLVCLAAFLIVVGLTRYVSVGSLVVVTIYLIEIVFYGQQGGFGVPEGALLEMYAIAALLLASAFFKHRANIKRLLSGTENKLSVGKKK